MFEHVLQTKLMVSVGELCSLSNDIRNQLRTAITPKCTLPPNVTTFQEPLDVLNNALPSFALNDTAAAPTQTSGTAKAPEPPVTNNVPTVDPPLYPYSGIPSHYQPPVNQNFGALDKHPNPAYQSMLPIYDIEQSKQVFERVLQTKLTVSVGELCSISNNIRNQLWTAITSKPNSPPNITAFQEPLYDLDNALPSFALNETCCPDHLLNNTA